jgi:hypothetical protein
MAANPAALTGEAIVFEFVILLSASNLVGTNDTGPLLLRPFVLHHIGPRPSGLGALLNSTVGCGRRAHHSAQAQFE